MFGLVERCPNGRYYIEIVPDRKAETLLRIIYDQSFIICDDEIDNGAKDGSWSEDGEEEIVEVQLSICHKQNLS
ncbi:unnamed protein product [Brachionus calyciflorus]|uniref:Uncharacterized protein n=1 Tax=Brachionus calyciflorus TaxID=104777 RepID=A0A813UQX1_9BILA|nr:unnamed protein product [Brachionus calyciflorus]